MRFFDNCFSLKGLIILCYLLVGFQLNAQTFPLKVKEAHLVTKSQKPFLVNGREADIYGNFSNELYNLQRYSFLGINTAYIPFSFANVALTRKGQLTRASGKKLKLLKRFVREASLYNIAVFVTMEDADLAQNNFIRNKYLKDAFKTMYRNKNVSWILNYQDLNAEFFAPNKDQLIAEAANDTSISADFFIQPKSTSVNQSVTKPTVLLTSTSSNPSDSILQTIRETAYNGIMSGAAGIITVNKSPVNMLYNPASQQLKQWAAIFDSIPFQNFVPFPNLIAPESTNKNIRAVTTKDSLLAAVYFKQLTTIHLNLSSFTSNLKLWWVNTVNGKSFETVINPFPHYQSFMPPFTDETVSEWLLIIRPLPLKNLQ